MRATYGKMDAVSAEDSRPSHEEISRSVLIHPGISCSFMISGGILADDKFNQR